MVRRPNPGESKSAYFNRDFVNSLIKPESRLPPGNSVSMVEGYHYIDTMLGDDATVDVKPYEIVKFHGSPFIPCNTDATKIEIVTAKGYHFSEANKYSLNWGIAQDFITKTQSAKVLLSGVSWVNTETLTLPTANPFHQYIELFDDTPLFCLNGRGTIINEPQTPYSICHLSQRIQPLLGKTTSSGLIAGTPGTAYLKEATTLYGLTTGTRQIPCWTDIGDIAPNTDIHLIPTNGIWYAISICSERLEQFTMLSDWIGNEAFAKFRLATATGVDQYGILEDLEAPDSIFTELTYGQTGWAIRTCDGRHFVIQAKCAQATVSPPETGCCTIERSPGAGGDITGQATEANCAFLGGTWTEGDCP